MTRYKHADFEEDDASSVGSVHLTEGVSSTATHIRYHTVRTRCPVGLTVWRSRTLLEKVLLLTTAALFLLTILLSLLLSAAPGHPPPESVEQSRTEPPRKPTEAPIEEKPCLTQSCVRLAASLLTAMNTSVDPCDDFYQYACGNWERANPIPDGKSIWGTFRKLEQQNLLVVRTILEQPIVKNRDGKAEQKAKMYYASCIDVNETVESLGGKPMLKLLEDVGGWNATTPNWNATAYNDNTFQKTLQLLHNRYFMSGLFSWDVGEDDRNSSRHIIQIDQGGLMLPTRESYLNKTENAKLLAAYLEYMTKICTLLGGEETSCKQQMSDVIEFETTLASIMAPPEDRRDEEKLYNLRTVNELQTLAPFIQWKEYFSDAMHFQNRKVGGNEKVVVYGLQYLQNLTVVVKEHLNSTKGRIVLNNYLVWQTVRTLSSTLSRAFRDAYKGLRKAMLGSEGGEEPWRVCVADTNGVLGFATGAMFVRDSHFQKMSKARAESMINSVRKAFKDNLKNLKWMDEKTRLAALDKADAISDMIGYPDFILDVKKLDEKYQDLENIKEDTYFQNNIEVSKYNMQKHLEKLDKPVDKTVWGMSPPTVNAYYTATKNQIAFPAGILQPPFFDPDHPMSVNYGAMGVVMGHELTHAFDDHGREYDKAGNLEKWWNTETIDRFNQQAGCIADQYSKYSVKGKNLNGNQTLGENIADNGGLKAAYHAYLEWAKENKPEPLLPGLDHDHRKLFFLSFAQVWCSASTDEALSLQIDKDPHPPPKFRVIGSLSNLPEFAKVFECKENSGMNPKDKCEVW